MLRLATIGTSWITGELIRGAQDSGLWQLEAVYSRSRETGEAFAQKHGAAHVFTDLEELASCPQVDAVYVASPNAFHYAQSKLLLEHGKHVLCEKTVCAQPGRLEELQALARANGLVFLEAIMYLHLPQRRILREAIADIGEVRMAKLDYCQRSSKLDAYLLRGELPNIFDPAMEAGALMDLGVYCVYPALDLFGQPEGVTAQAQLLESGVDGSDLLLLRYPRMQLVIACSKLGQAMANSDIQGTAGTVCVDSISRVAGISRWRPDGSVERLWEDEEKYRLMGWEAKDFFRYITQPQESREEYAYCSSLSLQVCRLMREARRQAGIRFPSDP